MHFVVPWPAFSPRRCTRTAWVAAFYSLQRLHLILLTLHFLSFWPPLPPHFGVFPPIRSSFLPHVAVSSLFPAFPRPFCRPTLFFVCFTLGTYARASLRATSLPSPALTPSSLPFPLLYPPLLYMYMFSSFLCAFRLSLAPCSLRFCFLSSLVRLLRFLPPPRSPSASMPLSARPLNLLNDRLVALPLTLSLAASAVHPGPTHFPAAVLNFPLLSSYTIFLVLSAWSRDSIAPHSTSPFRLSSASVSVGVGHSPCVAASRLSLFGPFFSSHFRLPCSPA